MQIPIIYLDATVIEEVPLALWREVFEAVGWPACVAARRADFTHDDIREGIQNDSFPDDLLHALEILHTLGTGAGREAVISVMEERNIRFDGLSRSVSERELAMRLYLAQRNSASMADVLARAQTQMQEKGDRRRYSEFLAKVPRTVGCLKRHGKALDAALRRHCRSSDLGDHIQVDVFDDDGVCVFSILRSDRMKKPLAVVPGQSGRAVIPFRPVHGDIIRYETSLGRLRIAARAGSMVEFYRRTLGSVLFGDEDFFSGDAVCNLRVLQERGRAVLDDHGVFGIGRVRLTECVWECGDRSLVVLRDRDCFDLVERQQLSLTSGTIVEAKLKVEVIGKSTRPVVVSVRAPSRIEVSQKRYEALIEELLVAVGIRMASEPAKSLDIWSLYPWRHTPDAWRGLFGARVDCLVERGVLRGIQLQAVEHPDHRDAGAVLRVEQMSEWDYYGVSEVEEVASRSLSATDVQGLELVPEVFRRYLCAVLDVAEAGDVWRPGEEVVEMGWIRVGGERFYLAYAVRQPSGDVGSRLRSRAKGAHVLLLVPRGRGDGWGVATVGLSGPVPARSQVVREGAMAYGLDDRLAAIDRAPEGAELVVDRRPGRVWVCGAEVQHVGRDSQTFRFLTMLAGSNGQAVSCDEITRALSAGRLGTDGTTTARQAKLAAKRLVVQALEAAGADPSEPFPTAGRGHYRCRLRSFVV